MFRMFFLHFEVWVKDFKVFDLTSDSDSWRTTVYITHLVKRGRGVNGAQRDLSSKSYLEVDQQLWGETNKMHQRTSKHFPNKRNLQMPTVN